MSAWVMDAEEPRVVFFTRPVNHDMARLLRRDETYSLQLRIEKDLSLQRSKDLVLGDDVPSIDLTHRLEQLLLQLFVEAEPGLFIFDDQREATALRQRLVVAFDDGSSIANDAGRHLHEAIVAACEEAS